MKHTTAGTATSHTKRNSQNQPMRSGAIPKSDLTIPAKKTPCGASLEKINGQRLTGIRLLLKIWGS